MQPKYRDGRSEFWNGYFESAVPYDEYLKRSDPQKAARWTALAEKIPSLTKEQTDRITGLGRKLNVLVYSGVWCGDCVRQGPMIERIAAACGGDVRVRFIERDASEALREELRILGALRVPVVVFLTEDFFEVARVGDRMLSTYRAKVRREVGPACYAGLIPPPPDELATEMEEWVAAFERVLLMLRLSPMLRERYGD
jgi:thiol-disulfide isomerase/thioredoxin